MLQFKYKELPCDVEVATWVCGKWDVEVVDYDGDSCSYWIKHNGVLLEEKHGLEEDFHEVCELVSVRFNALFSEYKCNE